MQGYSPWCETHISAKGSPSDSLPAPPRTDAFCLGSALALNLVLQQRGFSPAKTSGAIPPDRGPSQLLWTQR